MSAAKAEPRHHGLVLIDKPEGLTSHDVVAKIRKMAGQKKVGHTGTLDPMATGLMAVLLGSATRLEPYLTKMNKSYLGQLELGLLTDTDDVTGQVLSRNDGPYPLKAEVAEVLASFLGVQDQRPPDYSAIKVGGKRAYEAAREGAPLQLACRRVTAYNLEIMDYAPPRLTFKAEVSSGYYIRSLARDLGHRLGMGGAALSALRRLTVGPAWSLDKAFTLEAVNGWNEDGWADNIISPADALPLHQALRLEDSEAVRYLQGQRLKLPLDVEPGQYKVLSASGLLLGLAEAVATDYASLGGPEPHGPFLRPLRVFNNSRNITGLPNGKE